MKSIITLFSFLIFNLTLNAQITDSSIREVKLKGAVNFRDIGGYKTNNGKTVKSKTLFRAAALNGLMETDLKVLSDLNIKYDFDFRGPFEVQPAPDKIVKDGIIISLPAGSENIGDTSFQRKMGRSMMSDSFLLSFYTNLEPFKARYKPLFDSLLSFRGVKPLVFHCTAGKDRTGIAAALILYALGVKEETIFDDYEATNYYRKNENQQAIKTLIVMYHLNENVASNLMLAKRSYIQSTFQTIKDKFGTIDNFLDKEFGFDIIKIQKLRKYYTF